MAFSDTFNYNKHKENFNEKTLKLGGKFMIVAYMRVSTKEQDTRRQERAIKEYCKANNIEIDKNYIDKESGKNFDRKVYIDLKRFLRKGDTIIIKEMDRLGRNKVEVKKEIEWFKNNGIILRILDIPTTLMDFSKFEAGMAKAMMEMVNNILIEVLGTISEEERIKIRQRQAEGIAEVKRTGRTKTGKPMGRPIIKKPKEWEWIYKSWKAKDITGIKAMELLDIKKDTFYAFVREEREKEKESV